MESLQLRCFQEKDVAVGLRLKEQAGWNQTEDDWRIFLEQNPTGCFVASRAGQPVGTAMTLRHGDLAWVGMVLVDEQHRRVGIGRRLLEQALLSVEDCERVGLDATPLGEPLYESLGFQRTLPLARFVARGGPKAIDRQAGVASLSLSDIEQIAPYDREIFGYDRTPLLEALLKRRPTYAFQLRNTSALEGYALGRSGSRYEYAGPIVAANKAAALALLDAIRSEARQDRPLAVDAFTTNDSWTDELRQRGFREERPLLRMFRDKAPPPGRPQEQWAPAGLEFG